MLDEPEPFSAAVIDRMARADGAVRAERWSADGLGQGVAGPAVPVPAPLLVGGGAPAVGQQLQAQGGQVSPDRQAGQAHPQPPVPPPETGFIWTQEPMGGQGAVTQAIASSTQPHASAESAAHDEESVCVAHGLVVAGCC